VSGRWRPRWWGFCWLLLLLFMSFGLSEHPPHNRPTDHPHKNPKIFFGWGIFVYICFLNWLWPPRSQIELSNGVCLISVFHVSGLTCGLSEISSRVFLGEVAWGITLVLSVGWEILGGDGWCLFNCSGAHSRFL